MIDLENKKVGCLVIFAIICVVAFFADRPPPKGEIPDLMDEFVRQVNFEATAKIESLKENYARKKAERNARFAEAEANLKSLIEVENRAMRIDKRKNEEKEARVDELRTFALKEAPGVWQTLQHLEAEQKNLTERTRELGDTLRRFGSDPATDEDIKGLEELRKQIKEQIDLVRGRLESAYIAARKYEAMPHRSDFNELMKKSLEDGIKTAELAERRYTELKEKELTK